jgi:hypothetical protein
MILLLRRTLVVASVAVLLAVATIGIVRATSAAPSTPAAPLAALPASPGAISATGSAAIAADLDPELAVGLDAILAADQKSAAPDAAGPRGQLRHLAAWRRLVHATVVVDLKQGGLTTVQIDHGTISAVGATTLTISEAGGGSVTVALGDESHVRRNGAKAAVADLKTADEVFVMSKVEAGGTTAYLVVVPRT